MGNLGTLLYQIGADITELRKAVDEVNKATKKMDDDMKKVSLSTEALNAAFGYMKTAIMGIGVTAFARDLLQTAMALDTMNNKLRFAVGNAQSASQALKMIQSESNRLGLNVMTAADAFGSFATAAKGTSLEGFQAKEIFLAIAEASAVMGLSNEQSSGAMLALTQIMSKGKVQAEELRGQLGERIPGAFQIAARAMSMTTAELDKFMADGKLVSNDFLPKFAAQIRKEMAGSVGEAAQSTRAHLNRLENAWLELKKAMLDTGFLKVASDSMDALSKIISKLAEVSEREAKARKDINNVVVGNSGMTGGDMKAAYFRNLGIPTEKKRPILSPGVFSQLPGLSAYEEFFPSPEVEEAAKKFWDDQKAAVKEYRKDIKDSWQVMREEFTKIDNLVKAGEIGQEEAQAGYAKAWKEYEKGYPVDSIREQIVMNKELSKMKLEQLEQERNATEFNFRMGKIDGQAYASSMNQIYDQMAAHRIAALQEERAQIQKMMGLEAGDPTKNWMEKDLAQSKYSSQLRSIDAEIAAIQTNRQQQSQQMYMEQIANSEAVVAAELSALKIMSESTSLTFEERVNIGQYYLEKRKEQIEQEKQAMLRARVPEEIVKKAGIALGENASVEAMGPLYQQQATIAQLRSQYVALTGNIYEQITAQKALAVATGEKNAAENKLPEIRELYRQIAQEQAKLLELRKSGSFGEGFAYEMDKVAKNMPTAFDEGRESVNQLKKAIDDASGSLADMFVGRKVDAAQFFQQIIRDMLKVQIQGMLMKSVFGEGGGGGGGGFLGSIFGGIGKILGGLFGGGSAGFADIGGEMAYPNALAGGGPAEAGHLYRVNELGMEWFKPKVSGTVIPISADASSKTSKEGAPTVVAPNWDINLINNGEPMRAEKGATREEMGRMTTDFHLYRLQSDPDYLATNKSLVGSRR